MMKHRIYSSPSPRTRGEGRGEGVLSELLGVPAAVRKTPLTLTLSPSTGRGDKNSFVAAWPAIIDLTIRYGL